MEEKIKNIQWKQVYNKYGKEWKQVYNKYGKVLRASAWYTANSCSCFYKYAGQRWEPIPFEPWMYEAANRIKSMLAISDELNGINFNRYDDFSQSLYFHSDDEPIFQKSDGTATIVSLSFGATRTFAFKLSSEADESAKSVKLKSGDILTMEGRTQQFFKHAVLPDPPDGCEQQVRYNATFRFVANHHRKCQAGQTEPY